MSNQAPGLHRIPLEPHALYLIAFGPLNSPLSSTSWFLALALPMRHPATNIPMSSTQWMYTYGLERGRKVERDTYTPGGGTREEINNVLIYRLTPPGQPAVPGVGVQKEDLAVAGGGVDMTSLSESQERDWVSKFFIWRVLMELKRIGRVRVSDPGCLWDEVCREVTEGLEERVRGSLEPRVIQCSYTF